MTQTNPLPVGAPGAGGTRHQGAGATKIALSDARPADVSADVLIVPVAGEPNADPAALDLDTVVAGRLRAEIDRRSFRAAPGDVLSFQTHDLVPAHTWVLVGCGETPGLADWYSLADATARQARELAAGRAAVLLGRHASPQTVAVVAQGVLLARYCFDRFRSRPEAPRRLDLTIVVPALDPRLREAVARAEAMAAGTCFARDLANTPAGVLTPNALGREARRLATPGLQVKVFHRRAIAGLGMGALLGVAQGSAQDPCFIELVYRPRVRARRRVALVGKGITFDSGGLSLKNADSMKAQKRDMAGSAVVLGVMHALPRLRPAVEVRGYVPAAENMPSGTAIRPGDVLRAFNGKTIEVLNTDAEGRLVLADALSYAAGKHPDVILDFATLTGAVRSALGTRYAAIMGTDRALVAEMIAAAAAAGENLWELPLVAEYRRDLDSRVADLKNVGEGYAATIVAGLFLREFVGDRPWAHIDFSSTVMSDGYACHPKGASGFGVRTVLEYLSRLSEGGR
jgi:leucyl aminopeptidase